MRPIVLLGLALTLSGCGFKTWWHPPFTGGTNPNMPVSDSPNMQRILGNRSTVDPIISEPGDIWPGQIASSPTLQDLEKTGVQSRPEAPVPGSPLSRGVDPLLTTPTPSRGSSSPPANVAPPLSRGTLPPPLSSYAAPPAAPPSPGPTGQVLQTPSGPSVVTGGGPGYQTTTGPGGAQSIVVPNGNGTSTVIHPDGRIETIPTPK
ncbi:MAG: hypothetical protein U1E70_24610 [Acetobacteraceae bacterium]|nr:hypothetical protein [Pseudomonadota bacterium]